MKDTSHTGKILLPDAAATRALGQKFGQLLPPNSVILLVGELGAGKTTFTQGLGEGLGITHSIVSPTFTLIAEYFEGRLPLYHFDLYRLEGLGAAELYPEIYWEGIEVEPGITAIEWSQRLPYKPPTYIEIQLNYTPDDQRQAAIALVGMESPPLALVHLLQETLRYSKRQEAEGRRKTIDGSRFQL
ncbi:tRNA (adenosine(37)-N6)-threonylcarbamoyltransferase complex ATPase subunit type 1 TsaE [Lusitaniella coriacea]|uniref:tRNA (adenosine(37)-N6)-threonylcarbamoyltransferase complex ATPase subunit type 1 TsaE n=1 Tax=Lusitaniella coriacea TaxID=1983105 RepID=UPI003CF239EA